MPHTYEFRAHTSNMRILFSICGIVLFSLKTNDTNVNSDPRAEETTNQDPATVHACDTCAAVAWPSALPRQMARVGVAMMEELMEEVVVTVFQWATVWEMQLLVGVCRFLHTVMMIGGNWAPSLYDSLLHVDSPRKNLFVLWVTSVGSGRWGLGWF